jgi:hypothetical protein
MKSRVRYILISLFSLALHGCDFTTLYPVFTEKDICFKSQLMGSWKPSKDQRDSDYLDLASVTGLTLSGLPGSLPRLADKAYLITRKDRSGRLISRHITFLVKIGLYEYFDCYPLETEEEKGYYSFFKEHYVKMHSLYRVDMKDNNRILLQEFDGTFTQGLIDTKRIRMRYEQQNYTGIYIITAPTEELQAYLIKFADNPLAYVKTTTSEFVRLP